MLHGARKPYAIWLNDIKQCLFMKAENIVSQRTLPVPATNFIYAERTLFAAASRRAGPPGASASTRIWRRRTVKMHAPK
jgi:hypothetical protein